MKGFTYGIYLKKGWKINATYTKKTPWGLQEGVQSKDHCVRISEGSANQNKSYCSEAMASTDRQTTKDDWPIT